ncbi:MAG: methionine--tRNA ligase [Sulfolobales archaeon]
MIFKIAFQEEIDIEFFRKIDLRVGLVKFAERIEGTSLLRLIVDLGELGERQIIAGVANWYDPKELVGKRVVVVANLKPKRIRGYISQGMILAAGCEEGGIPSILYPDPKIETKPGSKIC